MRIAMFSADPEATMPGTKVYSRLAALRESVGELRVFARSNWKDALVSGVRRERFDMVTVQDTAYLALAAWLFARRARAKYEVQVHGFERMNAVRRLLAGFVLRRADVVRVVSERLRREIERVYKVERRKIYVLQIYAQINADRWVKREGKDFVFLTVGRLVPVKNIALQIRAFVTIVKEFPHARLVIVGEGPLFQNFQFSITNSQLQDKIVLVGRQSDVGAFYREADAFLLTSDSEGWGVAVVEAAAHGLPIIMTDVGCAGEFIKNGENGLVVSVGDEIAVAVAMRQMIVDVPLRARLGMAARAAFLALPSAAEHIHKQADVWARLV